ncbi:hypothetical protein DFQ27_003061 [Actinomortierella ambigua]|uniref:carbonic anhydrase n=1 Tax=Actinomortierella ambigua TaxID=1343610 RepID=A0A9P6U6J9_9FUNG|nr:hypothetical protein DFQ27_003061 [Actinomortierella ambigua]
MKFTLSIAAVALASIVSTAFAAPDSAHFTYGTDDAGPQHWGDLSPLWAKCKTGQQQSPIDVKAEKPSVKFVKDPIKYKYAPVTNAVIGYNGHAVQVDWTQPANEAAASWIEVAGKKYKLVQFHFHTPSEHRVSNRFSEGELHLVHRADDGTLAVVGLFLELRITNNNWFNWITDLDRKIDRLAPGSDTTKTKLPIKKLDLPALAKAAKGFANRWTYAGSLTTPPCTEGVAWNVVKAPISFGLKQFNALVDLEGFNSRYIMDRPGK